MNKLLAATFTVVTIIIVVNTMSHNTNDKQITPSTTKDYDHNTTVKPLKMDKPSRLSINYEETLESDVSQTSTTAKREAITRKLLDVTDGQDKKLTYLTEEETKQMIEAAPTTNEFSYKPIKEISNLPLLTQ